MLTKIRSGLSLETSSIASARKIKNMDSVKVIVSYIEPKKTPDVYTDCETEDEANALVDLITDKVIDSKTLKFY